ncbi:MAG TPA: polysaccharide biosynthesis/export family protein [Candidatus Acidoferrales bacterium]|nr:polysaccharide biosynthesis/export family protein [Candidatus Acidoferrales bacterium]
MLATVRKALDCASPRSFWLIVSVFLSVQLAFAQANPQTPQQTNARIVQLAQASGSSTGEIPIGAGDVLHIDVFDVPDLTRDVRVGETGLISMPLIPDRISVAGCTPFQLESRLEKLLQVNGLVMHPQVSIMVKEQNSEPISVVGAVRHPMVFHEYRPTTLLEVLANADGISDDAGNSIIITRPKPPATACGEPDPPSDPAEGSQTITIRVSDLLQNGDPSFNIPVYGGDVITVPRAGIVYVAGAVVTPGGYTLSYAGEAINTMKVIALAHGLLGTAKTNSAVILRKDPATGKTNQINVKLKMIMNRKAPDILLHANDVLYVPDSTAKRALYKAGDAAVGITSGLIILRGSQ